MSCVQNGVITYTLWFAVYWVITIVGGGARSVGVNFIKSKALLCHFSIDRFRLLELEKIETSWMENKPKGFVYLFNLKLWSFMTTRLRTIYFNENNVTKLKVLMYILLFFLQPVSQSISETQPSDLWASTRHNRDV